MLLAAAEAVGRSAALTGQGLTGTPSISWPDLMRRKRSFTDPVPSSTETWMRNMGIEVLNGTARLTSESTIDVDGRVLTFDNLVVAAGAAPACLDIPGEGLLTTSEEFLDLDELPSRVVFVGGGYISFEFAWLARSAGSDVTIVHRSGDVLKGFDSDLAGSLVSRYERQGVHILLDTPVKAIERAGTCLEVVTSSETLETDMAVHGAGRVAAVDGLGLEDAGVEHDSHGVKVDSRLNSITNPRVWAAGDAAGIGMPLTPVASRQGAIVARNILGDEATFDPAAVPTVVFSDPPLASVGMSTSEAASTAGVSVKVSDMNTWFTQRRVNNDAAGSKIMTDDSTGRVLGAHLLGVGADEVINVLALAVGSGLTTDQLHEVLWAYPTASSDLNYIV